MEYYRFSLQQFELPECFLKPSTANIVIASLLMVGSVLSFLPQYIVIGVNKTVIGLNVISIALGLSSSLALLSNQGILQWEKVDCCQKLTIADCIANNLAGEQLLVVSMCQIIFYLMYILYYDGIPNPEESDADRIKRDKGKTRVVLLFIGILLVFALNALLASLVWYVAKVPGYTMVTWGRVLGILSAIFVIVQQVPQIVTTWKMKSGGSLSLGMLMIQFPGNLGVIGFQAGMNKADITTWGPYLISAIQNLILIVMLFFFMYRDRVITQNLNTLKDKLGGEYKFTEVQDNDNVQIKLEDREIDDETAFQALPNISISDKDL